MVEDTGYKKWLFIPVHRRSQPCGPMGDTVSRTFQSLFTLCLETMRAGFPLCAADRKDRSMIVTLPGRLVRSRACWTWKPLFSSWADYRPGLDVEFDKVMDKLGPALAGNPYMVEPMMALFRGSL